MKEAEFIQENQETGDDLNSIAEQSKPKRGALLLLRDMAICLAVIIIVLQVISPTLVYEHSMDDTLHPRDYVFLAKLAYKFGGEPERGDIIVFKSALKDENGINKNLIKRVIGLPGETISIHDGYVWIDGQKQIESYTKDGETTGSMEDITIPMDRYFVMGDNRRVSLDSRAPSVGLVKKEDIYGKVLFRLLPISRFGKIH